MPGGGRPCLIAFLHVFIAALQDPPRRDGNGDFGLVRVRNGGTTDDKQRDDIIAYILSLH